MHTSRESGPRLNSTRGHSTVGLESGLEGLLSNPCPCRSHWLLGERDYNVIESVRGADSLGAFCFSVVGSSWNPACRDNIVRCPVTKYREL
jgi:hypothetical protein